MRIALIIEDLDDADCLRLALTSVLRLVAPPAEVFITGDRIRHEATRVVEQFQRALACPLRDLRHGGGRASRSGSVIPALAVTDCDYICVTAADMILHPLFLADHRRFARRRHYIQGRSICLSRHLSETANLKRRTSFSWFTPGVSKRGVAFRSAWVTHLSARMPRRRSDRPDSNGSFWRDDLLRVAGDSAGHERNDPDEAAICTRLDNSGIRCISLRHAALAYRLRSPLRLLREKDRPSPLARGPMPGIRGHVASNPSCSPHAAREGHAT